MDAVTSQVIEWQAAHRALDERDESGDQCLVKPFAHGALVAVADGLGHGPEAAVAAKRAMAILEADADQPLTVLVRRCHEHLRPTRGAALSLASFDARGGTMTWLGVGSVDGVLLRATPAARSERLVPLGGLVGRQLPALYVSVVRVAPGDLLLLATDGIRQDFAESVTASGAAGPSAERILARHATGTDDALVVVARYRGGGRDEQGRLG
jgi:negative regulator of sigma-B (phosphoserine phosphatase)